MLRDLIKADIENVFFNEMGFASSHTLENKPIKCIVDSDALNRRTAQTTLNEVSGIGKSEFAVFVKTADIVKKVTVGGTVIFDSKQYIISNLYENDDITEMVLEQNRNI